MKKRYLLFLGTSIAMPVMIKSVTFGIDFIRRYSANSHIIQIPLYYTKEKAAAHVTRQQQKKYRVKRNTRKLYR